MKIGVVHCARSDYGIYLPVIRRIREHPGLKLLNYVTGMHLSPEFGRTEMAFAEDGFEIHERVEMLLSSDSPEGIAKSMGLGTIGFGQLFSRSRPDLLMLMGDRFEIHCAAVAALPFNIPIAHIHGGESTEGLIDEGIRHSLTKLSHLHFTSTEVYADRVRRMGEEDWRVWTVGAPGLDNILDIERMTREETGTHFGYDPTRPVVLVTFHPITLDFENTSIYTDQLLDALARADAQILFTYPNADTAGRVIIEKVNAFCQEVDRASVVVNASQRGYISLLSCVDTMVGNSSSGIIEAASFELPVVNIGSRQKGRIHGRNVVDCGHGVDEILSALETCLDPSFRETLRGMKNPYGDGRASERIVDRLASLEWSPKLLNKTFVDRP
jgi:GDP/UDP-N,N'-diacetylbacillosamine 2-epimerase (hydrolysing)